MRAGNRLDGLDGLRGLAALAVFAVHLQQIVRLEGEAGPFDLDTLLANGEHGVSLFFTLSGFLLALPFWRAMRGEGRIPDLRAYALRRAVRIIPAYYLVLTVLLLLGGTWRVPAGMADAVLHYTFLFNFVEFSTLSLNPPFWTLAVEMQFYLLLPLLFLVLRRLAVRTAVIMVLALMLLAYAGNVWLLETVDRVHAWSDAPWLMLVRPHGAALSHSLLAHLPHFLIGVVSAPLYLRIRPHLTANQAGSRAAEALFWLAAAALCLILSTPLSEVVQIPSGRYGLPVVPLLLACLVLCTPVGGLSRRLLSSLPMRELGRVSFGLYLVHLPVLVWLDHQLLVRGWDAPDHWASFSAGAMVVSLLLAYALRIGLEDPALRWVRKRAHA